MLRRHLPALGVLALGIVISLIASDLARRADETRVRSLLDLRAELHTRAIERRLASEIDQVQSLAHYLSVDNRTAAAQLAGYLLGIGHREFAMIAGITAHNERARERVEGVHQALAAKGMRLPAHRLVEKPFTPGAGREGLREVTRAAPRPTAVICGNDILALGASAECQALGIAVPQHISITGFDDMEIASLVTPGLTTVRFPTAELGVYAAQHLLHKLAGKAVALRRELPVELIVRGTTAAPA